MSCFWEETETMLEGSFHFCLEETVNFSSSSLHKYALKHDVLVQYKKNCQSNCMFEDHFPHMYGDTNLQCTLGQNFSFTCKGP